MSLGDLHLHLETDCPKRRHCFSCNTLFDSFDEFKDHFKLSCNSILIECDLCNQKYTRVDWQNDQVHACIHEIRSEVSKAQKDKETNVENLSKELEQTKKDFEEYKKRMGSYEELEKKDMVKIKKYIDNPSKIQCKRLDNPCFALKDPNEKTCTVCKKENINIFKIWDRNFCTCKSGDFTNKYFCMPCLLKCPDVIIK